MTAPLIALVAGLALATVAGWLLTRRHGMLAATGGEPSAVTAAALGLSDTGPTVVHFSAPWCGPCAAVRRVVDQVCTELGDVAHREIDIDANPVVVRDFSVLSLPTTLIFDTAGRQRYRATGVPSADGLRSALRALLA